MTNLDNPKVSILVPCFNVEKFLPECLNSLIGQTLKDIQIICINDGSTDSTLEIIRSFAQKDPRIEIIDKPNSGYGASMNKGLRAARGEYVGIVESDDYANRRMFKKLYKLAKKLDCDLVKSNYSEFGNGYHHRLRPFDSFAYKKPFDPAKAPQVIKVIPIIWAGLYRRSMLIENGIEFNETPGASYQDTSFVQRAWFASRKVALLKDSLLNYRTDNAASSVKSQAKVFAVCEEFATSERFLDDRPELKSVFAPTLNVVKHATYQWNYNRIASEFKLEFAKRWSEEMLDAKTSGFLDPALFEGAQWEVAQSLMSDCQKFCQDYPDEIPW